MIDSRRERCVTEDGVERRRRRRNREQRIKKEDGKEKDSGEGLVKEREK